MKIYVCDAVDGKTTKHWLKWLGENHELVVDKYFNPVYAEWADLIYIEWCETPAIEASRLRAHYDGVYDHMGVRGEREKQHSGDFDWSGKPIYIRAIDIDVYYGHFRAVQWENITGLIYIARHIWERMHPYVFPETLKIAHVPLSVDVEAWKFAVRDGQKKQIAWINHHWSAKGMPLMIQAFNQLIKMTGDPSWHLHIVENGKSTEWWLFDYITHMTRKFGLEKNITYHQSVPNVDEFLDGMDYVVSSSHKEAFSLLTAEALAKGIKTLTHNWWGAEDIWPEEIIWSTIDEFVAKMTNGIYDSAHYRELALVYDKSVEIKKLREAMDI